MKVQTEIRDIRGNENGDPDRPYFRVLVDLVWQKSMFTKLEASALMYEALAKINRAGMEVGHPNGDGIAIFSFGGWRASFTVPFVTGSVFDTKAEAEKLVKKIEEALA